MKDNSSDKAVIVIVLLVAIGLCLALAFGVVYFFRISSGSTAQYFLTVEEVLDRQSNLMERNIRISGVVLGETIAYDESTDTLTFTVANVPADYETVEKSGGLENVLHEAANNPNVPAIQVSYMGPQPEMLRDEAQAILLGQLGRDGVFYAEEILLRCPTRYKEAVPDQVQ